MNITKDKLSGIYLVADPAKPEDELLDKIDQAMRGGVSVLQIWNHWPAHFGQSEKVELIDKIMRLADPYQIPVLINEDWELVDHTTLHGVHFDGIPGDFDVIKSQLKRDVIFGITCSNDVAVAQWAETNDFAYISFCSMFPSPSVDSCDIVSPETVKKVRAFTNLPLFLSGGITLDNIEDFKALDFNGIAVISGILSAPEPQARTTDFKNKLASIRR